MGAAKLCAKADENGGFNVRQTVEDVANMRQASRWIVEICIDSGSYHAAAEVVLGASDGFQLYLERIEGTVNNSVSEAAGTLCAADPQPVLATLLAEIAYYRVWSQDVRASLPEGEGVAVLRSAFLKADRSRAMLLDALRSANERCLRQGANGIDVQLIEKEAAHV
jgi:hypothetical protein